MCWLPRHHPCGLRGPVTAPGRGGRMCRCCECAPLLWRMVTTSSRPGNNMGMCLTPEPDMTRNQDVRS
eukprot:803427-Alexandrium_andersonii.AAC.1